MGEGIEVMTGLDVKKPTFAPAYIVGIYPKLAEIAKQHGYALALHGSLQRDLDLIAIPWTAEAVSPTELMSAILAAFDLEPTHKEPELKPHGRLAWSIPLWWGAYIDLSVMPLLAERIGK
jgi:hypothetical protein